MFGIKIALNSFKNRLRKFVYPPPGFQLADTSKYFIVEKGKYKIIPREITQNLVERTIENSSSSWNDFWLDQENLNNYLCEERKYFYHQVLKHLLPYIKNSLIEVGCGSGHFLKLISKTFPHLAVCGVDFSESAVALCKKLIPQGTFLSCDIYNLPTILENNFDLICCSQVLEHLDKPELALNQLVKIAGTRAAIAITVPSGAMDNYLGHINFWSRESLHSFVASTCQVLFCDYIPTTDAKNLDIIIIARPNEKQKPL